MDEFLEIRHQLEKANEQFSFIDMVLVRPSLYWIPFIKQRRDTLLKSNEATIEFAKRQIEKREEDIQNGSYQMDENCEPKDFLDAYLLERNRRKKQDGDVGHYTKKQLIFTIIDLWQAGMETTIITLTWGFLYLLKTPTEKMREELRQVVGEDRDVELQDRQLLPYCNAAINEVHRLTSLLTTNEVHRLTSLLTTNVLRRNIWDTTIDGYPVPAGTENAVVMSALFKDAEIFPEPRRFEPERYLGSDGKAIEQKVIPFGIGKRACLGEGLARAEIFLILLNIVKNYRIIEDGDIPEAWEKGKMTAFVKLPVNYECIFEKVK
uniref:Unspecific monooxygenase n=1 Tax=Steinernema glaseri TaxID=37863 RepID=A0A1I8A1P2_9BILA